MKDYKCILNLTPAGMIPTKDHTPNDPEAVWLFCHFSKPYDYPELIRYVKLD